MRYAGHREYNWDFLHTTIMLFSKKKTKMQDTQRQAIKQPQSKL